MASKSCCLIVIALLAAAVSGAVHAQAGAGKAGQEIADLSRECDALERQIDKLLYHVPNFFDPADEKQRALAVAKASKVGEIEVKAAAGAQRLELEDGSPAPVELRRLEISGRAPYGNVLTFLHRMGELVRLTDLETLRVKVEAGNVVRFMAVFAVPRFVESTAAGPLPPDVVTAYRNKLRELKATHRLLTELTARCTPRLVVALVAFDNLNRERATVLSELEAGPQIVLKGVVAGATARDRLKPALAKAGFRVSHLEMAPAGLCQAFVATARLEASEVPWDYVPANGLFDAGAAEACSPQRVDGRVTVRGTATAADALTLHLHGVRLSDAFFVLNKLTSQSFVIVSSAASEAKRRINLDVEGASLEEALAAMSAVGVAVGPGPLHIVSRTQQPAATAPRPGGYTGEAIDLLVRNADLKVLLCTLSMVLQKPVWVPRKLDEVVTAFSENLPADQLLDGLSAAAGFVARQEADRWIVGPEARLGNQEAVNACPPPSDDDLSSVPADIPSHLASLREALPELATGDLDLAGLASFKGPWKAYVYTPSQRLISLDAGQELLDAKVGSIGPTGVSYTKGSATVDVPLRP